MWRLFYPTFWDISLLAGSIGLFALLYLIMCRLVPIVSMHETRRLLSAEADR
jgi:molybdopterin-containing oxidoreductase family membrane subunit